VRYADNFVVISHNLSVIQKYKKTINEFLAGIGLELHDAKTKIVHTRIAFEKNEPSFEFLGFKIKHFNVEAKKHSVKNNQGHNFGFRLLIFLSKNSRIKHFAMIDRILGQNKTAKQS